MVLKMFHGDSIIIVLNLYISFMTHCMIKQPINMLNSYTGLDPANISPLVGKGILADPLGLQETSDSCCSTAGRGRQRGQAPLKETFSISKKNWWNAKMKFLNLKNEKK